MALKLLFFLAIVKLVISVPDPDPDSIDIHVKQVVNGGGCCPGTEPGCVYGFKTYADGAIIDDICMELKCMKGNWEIVGKVHQDCGNCIVTGDPHIYTYDNHSLTNGPSPMTSYLMNATDYTGEFVLSQYERDPVPGFFGVYANFTLYDTFDYGPLIGIFASGFNYSEPGIEVELILPENLYSDPNTDPYCENVASPDDPLCATKILVNGQDRSIMDNGPPGVFQGTDGTVLIFKYGTCPPTTYLGTCTILVVGSKGFVLRLEIDPWDIGIYYRFNIFALPHLQPQLYGLCDTFTGEVTNTFTLKDGTQITNFDNMDQFITSWELLWDTLYAAQ